MKSIAKSIANIFSSHEVLDESGRHVNGTDKHGPNHQYGYAYEDIFCGLRNTATLMMEVGVADGSSLIAWREVFPGAICVGLDIMPDPAHKLSGKERIEFYQGDATKREDCEKAAGGRLFDVIVDDASHLLKDVLCTLFWLWPSVKPGGIYIVEDGGLQDCERVKQLFPMAYIVETQGPFGGIEPLVVLRKPLCCR